MNTLEKQGLEIGESLVKEWDAKAYKASFEDEGASFEDISRAKIITEKVGLNLDIKMQWEELETEFNELPKSKDEQIIDDEKEGKIYAVNPKP